MRLIESSDDKPKGVDLVIRWLAYGSILVIVLVTVAAQVAPGAIMQIVSSFITFFASVFLSFVVTRHYAQVTAREELKRLAEAAGSRIFLLSVQMRQLVSDLSQFDSEDKLAGVFVDSVATQIDRLSAQADLSVEDLERIADVDLSLPAMRDAAQTRVEAATKREHIPCPHCAKPVDVTIGTAPGANKHGKCDSCRKGFVVHRMTDGTLKVSHTGYFRIDCPNPQCDNEIGINRRDNEWGTIIRNCFECYARVRYDLDVGKIVSFEIEVPQNITVSDIQLAGDQRRGPCPACGYSLVFQGYKNRREQELTSCPRCTKLVLVAGG
jgi:hypothetical protein